MNEKQFYQLINYQYPGDNATPAGTRSALQVRFGGVIEKPSTELELAAGYRQGQTATTALENLNQVGFQPPIPTALALFHPRFCVVAFFGVKRLWFQLWLVK